MDRMGSYQGTVGYSGHGEYQAGYSSYQGSQGYSVSGGFHGASSYAGMTHSSSATYPAGHSDQAVPAASDSNTRKMGVWIRDAVTGKRRLLIREIPVTQLPKQSQQLTKPVESVKQTSKKKSGVKRKLESPKKSPQKSPHTPKKKSKTAGPFSTPQPHYQTSRLSESDGTSESDEDYFPPTTAFDSDDDYEPATSSPTKKGKKGSKKATPSPTKSPATPKSKAVQSPGNLPFGQIGQSPKVEFFNSVSPSKNFPKPSGSKKRSFNSAKAQKREVNADLKKTKAVIRAAVEQSLQAAAASISVKSEPAAHFMTTEEKKASALCSIGKGKRSKQVRRRVQEPFRTQQIIVNDNRPHVKPELTENVDPNDLLEKAIESIKAEERNDVSSPAQPDDEESSSHVPVPLMTEKYIARMKRIQANRRRWATKESEGFFNKINRLVEKAEQEMIDEKEKFAKLTDPENTDNVSQILAELDDLSLRKTLENAVQSNYKTNLIHVAVDSTCGVCGQTFATAQSYVQHLLNHVGGSLSQKKFLSPKLSQDEVEDFRNQKFISHNWFYHACEICGHPFATVHDKIDHLEGHVEHATTQCCYCHLCKRRFDCLEDFFRHQRLHGGACFICGKRNKGLRHACEHLMYHINCHTFQSAKSFPFAPKLQLETRNPTMCSYCGNIYTNGFDLWNHLKEHYIESANGVRRCDRCNVTYISTDQYFVHLRARHRHWTGGEFKCTYCDGSFTLKQSLQKHLNFVGGCAAKVNQNMIESGKRKTTVSEILNKTSINFNMVKLAHQELKDMLKCSHCQGVNRYFKTRAALLAHERTHHSDRLYTCQSCDKVFNSPMAWDQHFEQEHARFQCLLCLKEFDSFSDLKECLGKHFKRLNFYCKLCQKPLLREDGAKHLLECREFRRHHPSEVETGQVCESTVRKFVRERHEDHAMSHYVRCFSKKLDYTGPVGSGDDINRRIIPSVIASANNVVVVDLDKPKSLPSGIKSMIDEEFHNQEAEDQAGLRFGGGGSINRTEVTDLHMKAFGQNASLTSCKVEPQVCLEEAGEEASEIPENFQTEDDEQSETPEPVSTSNAQLSLKLAEQVVFAKKEVETQIDLPEESTEDDDVTLNDPLTGAKPAEWIKNRVKPEAGGLEEDGAVSGAVDTESREHEPEGQTEVDEDLAWATDDIGELMDNAERMEKAKKDNDERYAEALKVYNDGKPQKPKTSYFLWMLENKDKYKEEYGDLDQRDFVKKLGELWRDIGDDERTFWNQEADIEREEYYRDMDKWMNASIVVQSRWQNNARPDLGPPRSTYSRGPRVQGVTSHKLTTYVRPRSAGLPTNLMEMKSPQVKKASKSAADLAEAFCLPPSSPISPKETGQTTSGETLNILSDDMETDGFEKEPAPAIVEKSTDPITVEEDATALNSHSALFGEPSVTDLAGPSSLTPMGLSGIKDITSQDLAIRDGECAIPEPDLTGGNGFISRAQCEHCSEELIGLDTIDDLLSEHYKTCQTKLAKDRATPSVQYLCNICQSIFRKAEEVKRDLALHFEFPFLKCIKCPDSPIMTHEQMLIHMREVHGVGLSSAAEMSRFTWVVESFNEGWSPESRVEFKKHLTYNVSRIVPVTQEEARSKALTRSSLPNPEHNEDEGNGESLSHPGETESEGKLEPVELDMYLQFSTRGKGIWCRICTNGFTNVQMARKHVAHHIKENELGVSKTSDQSGTVFGRARESSSKMKMFCSQCKHFFDNPNQLLAHVNTVHRAVEMVTYYQCQMCGEMFNTQNEAVQHLENTHYAQPVQCNLCDEYFSCPEGGIDHVKSVHGTDEEDLIHVDDDTRAILVLDRINQIQRPPFMENN